jgi:hypothetical protein
MRTAEELIQELEREWEGAWRAALIVQFEEEIKLVFADEQDRHFKLASLMSQGGEPGALFRATKEGNSLKVETRFLPGYSALRGEHLARHSARIAQAIQGGMGLN